MRGVPNLGRKRANQDGGWKLLILALLLLAQLWFVLVWLTRLAWFYLTTCRAMAQAWLTHYRNQRDDPTTPRWSTYHDPWH